MTRDEHRAILAMAIAKAIVTTRERAIIALDSIPDTASVCPAEATEEMIAEGKQELLADAHRFTKKFPVELERMSDRIDLRRIFSAMARVGRLTNKQEKP